MPISLIGNLPERLTQELLVGKLLVGGLGVKRRSEQHLKENGRNARDNQPRSRSMNSFPTTLTPNPEKLHKYYSVME